jgi:general secretion pathway protein C
MIRQLPKAVAERAKTPAPPNAEGRIRSALEQIQSANIFHSTLSEKEPEIKVPENLEPLPVDEKAVLAGEDCPPTTLRASLSGTVYVSSHPKLSYAAVYDQGLNDAVVLRVGDVLMREAKVRNIQVDRVVLEHNGAIECLQIAEEEAAAPGAGVAPGPPASAEATETGEGVRQLGPSAFEVSQGEIDNTLSNLSKIATQARIVPNFRDGKPNGFKLLSVRPDSIYQKIGLRNGDVLQRVNGLDINSPDKALEVYQKLRESRHITLQVMRGDSTLNYDYTIR